MKKYASIIVGLMLVVMPVTAHADVNEDQMINLLRQVIALLTQQLNYLLEQRGLANHIIEIQPQATTTPSIIYTTATTTYAIPVQNSPVRDAPVPSDTTKPDLWEAQFGKDISAEYTGQPVIRIVTSEAVDLSKIKFHFRNFPDNLDWVESPVTVSSIALNQPRGQENCSVKCDRPGYESIFSVSTPLTVRVPRNFTELGENNALYGPEFSLPDVAGNYSNPWQSARDITSFDYIRE